jgi:hypothetical protein
MPEDGKPSEIIKLLRTRLNGPADLTSLMWTFVVIGLGGRAPWEQEDRSRPDPAPTALQLLNRAAGVDRAMGQEAARRPQWLPADFDPREFIAELRDAGGFTIEDAARPIRDATDEALLRARADAMLFSKPLATIGAVIEDLLGEDVAGLGSLRAIAQTTAFGRASLIRTMLILRPLAGDEAFRAIAELVDSVERRFAAIAELRAALPQHESVLRGDYAERLAALEPQHADEVRHDVGAHLHEHPSLAEALGAAQPSLADKSQGV